MYLYTLFGSSLFFHSWDPWELLPPCALKPQIKWKVNASRGKTMIHKKDWLGDNFTWHNLWPFVINQLQSITQNLVQKASLSPIRKLFLSWANFKLIFNSFYYSLILNKCHLDKHDYFLMFVTQLVSNWI